MKMHIDKAQKLAGFIAETAPMGATTAKVTTKAYGTSDEELFHRITEHLWNVIINDCPAVKVVPDSLFNFIYVIHQDESADLYLNHQIEIYIRPRRDIAAGEMVTSKDIADIGALRFLGVVLEKTDRVFCCFKADWKFGWYFNFFPDGQELDINEVPETCGSIYRYLKYEYLYSVLENDVSFSAIVKDGWFPFSCILDEFRLFVDMYKDKIDIASRTEDAMNKIDTRLDPIIEKWWDLPVFQNKKQQIEAGIAAYRQANDHGYIQCISTLYPLVEGIMREVCKLDGISADKKLPEFIDLLIEKCKRRNKSSDSLLLPDAFLQYLKEEFNKPFDADAASQDASRNTVAHGISNDYSRKRALQSILILDQVHFYLI
jgi:hypothetical protein